MSVDPIIHTNLITLLRFLSHAVMHLKALAIRTSDHPKFPIFEVSHLACGRAFRVTFDCQCYIGRVGFYYMEDCEQLPSSPNCSGLAMPIIVLRTLCGLYTCRPGIWIGLCPSNMAGGGFPRLGPQSRVSLGNLSVAMSRVESEPTGWSSYSVGSLRLREHMRPYRSEIYRISGSNLMAPCAVYADPCHVKATRKYGSIQFSTPYKL
jgi:hypothetical protein